jgi:hypothetical protein
MTGVHESGPWNSSRPAATQALEELMTASRTGSEEAGAAFARYLRRWTGRCDTSRGHVSRRRGSRPSRTGRRPSNSSALGRRRPGRAGVFAGVQAHLGACIDKVSPPGMHGNRPHRRGRQRGRQITPARPAIRSRPEIATRESTERYIHDVPLHRVDSWRDRPRRCRSHRWRRRGR